MVAEPLNGGQNPEPETLNSFYFNHRLTQISTDEDNHRAPFRVREQEDLNHKVPALSEAEGARRAQRRKTNI